MADTSFIRLRQQRGCGTDRPIGLRTSLFVAALVAAFGLCGGPAARAANVTWLSTGTNMNSGTAVWSAAPNTNDNGYFTTAATGTNPYLTADLTMRGLYFSTAASSGWTVAGASNATLTLVSNAASNGNAAISGAATSGTNTISANIALIPTTGGTSFIGTGAGSTLALTGNISGSSIQLYTTGTVLLSGSNSFTGRVRQTQNSTLLLNSTYALGGGGGLEVTSASGFSINNTSGAAVTLAGNNNIFFTGAGAQTLVFTGSNDLSFGSGTAVLINAGKTITPNSGLLTIGSIDVSGVNSGTYTLAKAGNGTLAITGAAGAGYGGGFNLTGGTLQVGNNTALGTGTFTIGTFTVQAINADISLANNYSFGNGVTFSGSRSLTLSGNGSLAGGGVIINSNIGGDKALTFAGNIDLNNSGTAASTKTLQGSGNTTFTTGTLFSTSTGGQALTITNTGTTRLQGVVASQGQLSQTGAGTVILSGTISNVSGVTVNNASAIFEQSSTGVITGTQGFSLTNGIATFSGSNSYTGLTTVSNLLKLNSANALAGGPLTIASGGILGLGTGNSSFTRPIGTGSGQVAWNAGGFAAFGSDATLDFGGVGASGTVAAPANFTLGGTTADKTVDLVNVFNLGNSTKNVVVNDGAAAVDAKISGPVIGTGGAGSFGKGGAGTLELTGANTFQQQLVISAGQVRFTGTGSMSAGSVRVNGSGAELKWNSSVALSRPLTLTQGYLSGTGTIGTAVSVGSGAILAPGNSPGTQAFSAGLSWLSGGTYNWEINDAAGSLGGNPGWDLIDVTGGTLNLASLSEGSQFTLDLITLNGLVSGSMANYTSGQAYTWQIVRTGAGGVVTSSGAAAGGTDLTSLFNILTTNWASGPAPTTVQVKVSSGGTGLDLVVVPEPETLVLAGVGVVMAGWSFWKRRRIASICGSRS